MEILIPGLILVALMVYASTRIKKIAARAFQREILETDEFRIVKPEGFICPANENSTHLFEAYSKEYGDDDLDKFRKASVTLQISDEDDENDCDPIFETFRKRVETNNKVYDLKIKLLKKHKEEFARKTEEILESFAVK